MAWSSFSECWVLKQLFDPPLSPSSEVLWFLFGFCHISGIICISEAVNISPGNLDPSLCFIQPGISHDVLSVQFSCSVVSDSLWPHGLQHARPPCPSPTPRVYPNSCPLSWWCHPTIIIFCRPFLLPRPIFPCIRVFSNESVLCIRWPVLEFQLQHLSFQWTLRNDLL